MFYVHVSPLVTEALRIQVFNRMLDKNDPNQWSIFIFRQVTAA